MKTNPTFFNSVPRPAPAGAAANSQLKTTLNYKLPSGTDSQLKTLSTMNSQQHNPLPQSGSMTINYQHSTINSFWPSLSTYGTVLAEWRILMGPDWAPGQG